MAVAIPYLMMAAAAMTAVSAISQAQSAKATGEYNAAVATRNAGVARAQAAADAEAQQRHARRVIGAARAGYGASGLSVEGSPLEVLEMSAANAELDRQNILYRGELRAMGYESDAALETARSDAADRAGYIQAGSALLMGAGRAGASRPTATTGYQLGDYGADYDIAYGSMT